MASLVFNIDSKVKEVFDFVLNYYTESDKESLFSEWMQNPKNIRFKQDALDTTPVELSVSDSDKVNFDGFSKWRLQDATPDGWFEFCVRDYCAKQLLKIQQEIRAPGPGDGSDDDSETFKKQKRFVDYATNVAKKTNGEPYSTFVISCYKASVNTVGKMSGKNLWQMTTVSEVDEAEALASQDPRYATRNRTGTLTAGLNLYRRFLGYDNG